MTNRPDVGGVEVRVGAGVAAGVADGVGARVADGVGAGVAAGVADEELLTLLIRTVKALVDRLRASAPPRTGGAPETTVVHALAAHYLDGRKDATTADLARYLRITKQSASEVVGLLEQHGIVTRAPHPRDGRARVLLITEEGRAKMADGRRRWHLVEDEWAGLVGHERLDVMRQALRAYLAATEPVPGGPPR